MPNCPFNISARHASIEAQATPQKVAFSFIWYNKNIPASSRNINQLISTLYEFRKPDASR
jgi:hypothetical protein